ncbi:hypothetical protein DPMN_108332 [Dreissena polymorpha]|uniref:DDE Tnp4 domain-containing protein n=1 Tax=Dreissena polymorpha TaxID=45954 RepID=A0A9D4K8N2_DREPO|nr:hypothetical protein DPMN_108332 [Dreissena polymorpha]
MLGVVGAVDGTHSACPAPTSKHRSLFISNLVFQAVYDSHLKCLDICPGWPSSVHDAYVYRNGPVAQSMENLPHEYHVLEDSVYRLTKNLLVPYGGHGHLYHLQKKFVPVFILNS